MAYAFSGPLAVLQEASASKVFGGGAGGKGLAFFRAPQQQHQRRPPLLDPASAHAGNAHDVASSTRGAMGAHAAPSSTSGLWGRWGSLLEQAWRGAGQRRGSSGSPSSTGGGGALPTQTVGRTNVRSDNAALGVAHASLATELRAKPFLSEFVTLCDDVSEISYATMMADLSDISYEISRAEDAELLARHGLQLVCTSQTPVAGPQTREAWAAQVQEQRKGRARTSVSPDPPLLTGPGPAEHQHLSGAAAAAVSQAALLVEQQALDEGQMEAVQHEQQPCPGSPVMTPSVSIVALSTLEGDIATSDAAQGGAQVPVLTFVQTPASPPSSPRSPLSATSSPLLSPDALVGPGSGEGNDPAAATADAMSGLQVDMPVLVQGAAPGSPPAGNSAALGSEPVSSQAAALTASPHPPAPWFACDDPVTRIRYIVIQGSTTLEHWHINLQFEPTVFEDPVLGVRVHRGVYMAALRLYDDVLPLVRKHLATSPFASVAFTGHSLGGSLATVLLLLLAHRGALPPDCVSPTYTFGAPAVFCGGAAEAPAPGRCAACGLSCPHTAPAAPRPPTCARPRGLLARLGLGEEHIVNVIMHRDIVPRAFVCDYTLVADLLLQLLPSLKSLAGLQGPTNGHKSLYTFLGRTAILQPDAGCSFVQPGDARHPYLPAAPGLYRMVTPAPRLRVHGLHGSFDLTRASTDAPWLRLSSLSDDEEAEADVAAAAAERRALKADKGAASATADPTAPAPAPENLKEAVQHFMNHPHPLTMLTEYGAYGPNGTISRYHNPRNYTLGLLAAMGQAPHQLAPPPGHGSLPASLEGGCTADFSRPDPTTGAHAVDGWDDIALLCDGALQELAVSPDAARLVRGEPALPSAATPLQSQASLLSSLLSAVGYGPPRSRPVQ